MDLMDFISKSDFTTVGGKNNAGMEPVREEKKNEEFDFDAFDNTAKADVSGDKSGGNDNDFFNFNAGT